MGNISFHDKRCAARAIDLSCQRFQQIKAARYERNRGAAFSECMSRSFTDPTACSGNERYCAGQFMCHGLYVDCKAAG
jgi:hypothetical protein